MREKQPRENKSIKELTERANSVNERIDAELAAMTKSTGDTQLRHGKRIRVLQRVEISTLGRIDKQLNRLI